MKLIKALELADECGLGTVMEAMRNVQIHAPSLFEYEKMNGEYRALLDEWYSVMGDNDSFGWNSSVRDVMEWLKKDTIYHWVWNPDRAIEGVFCQKCDTWLDDYWDRPDICPKCGVRLEGWIDGRDLKNTDN